MGNIPFCWVLDTHWWLCLNGIRDYERLFSFEKCQHETKFCGIWECDFGKRLWFWLRLACCYFCVSVHNQNAQIEGTQQKAIVKPVFRGRWLHLGQFIALKAFNALKEASSGYPVNKVKIQNTTFSSIVFILMEIQNLPSDLVQVILWLWLWLNAHVKS